MLEEQLNRQLQKKSKQYQGSPRQVDMPQGYGQRLMDGLQSMGNPAQAAATAGKKAGSFLKDINPYAKQEQPAPDLKNVKMQMRMKSPTLTENEGSNIASLEQQINHMKDKMKHYEMKWGINPDQGNKQMMVDPDNMDNQKLPARPTQL